MNITVVYGNKRKGSTYNIARQLISAIHECQVREVFLPDALPVFCVSCCRCFVEEKGTCSHGNYVGPLREALLWADLIILTSPVYSFHVSGQMKVFLDHFANMWLVHRPEKEMFLKQGVVIATAAGPVYRKTLQTMKDSLDFWGVSRTYKLGFAVMQMEWDGVSDRIKGRIENKVHRAAGQIMAQHEKNRARGKVRPNFRTWKWFHISRMMQKYFKANPADVMYWEEMGWQGKKRPWR